MMMLVSFADPSFWILVSFLLLCTVFFSRGLKRLSQQLKTRQETIARQITEVSTLYEEAKSLLKEEQKHLESKEAEAVQLKIKVLEEIERKKETIRESIKYLHQKHELNLSHKMQEVKEKYISDLVKKIMIQSCSNAEKDLRKTLDKEKSALFLRAQIDKLTHRK